MKVDAFITAAAYPNQEPRGKLGCVVLIVAYCPEILSRVVLTSWSVGRPGNLVRVTASMDLMIASVVAIMMSCDYYVYLKV